MKVRKIYQGLAAVQEPFGESVIHIWIMKCKDLILKWFVFQYSAME